MSYIFRAFRAVDEPKSCIEFHEGHTKILVELGILNLTSNVPLWMEDEDVLVISALDAMSGELVGGIRLHKYNSKFPLPVVEAVKAQDHRVLELFESLKESGAVESCGLWNSKKVFGRGISPLLARCSIALSASLNPRNVFCFSAPYTLRMIMRLGFSYVEEVGDNGKFNYPTEKFVSTILRIEDLYSLERADAQERERIFSLMQSPVQEHLESSQGKELLVNYNLIAEIDVEERRHEHS